MCSHSNFSLPETLAVIAAMSLPFMSKARLRHLEKVLPCILYQLLLRVEFIEKSRLSEIQNSLSIFLIEEAHILTDFKPSV